MHCKKEGSHFGHHFQLKNYTRIHKICNNRFMTKDNYNAYIGINIKAVFFVDIECHFYTDIEKYRIS